MTTQGLTPAMSAPVMGQTASSTTSTGSSSSSNSSTSLQTEFLNLLVTELQNQDPTSPVDPTAMVGQMVSLNELDQLISINQLLQQSVGSGSSTTPPATGGVQIAANNNIQPTAPGAISGASQATGIAQQISAVPQSTTAYPNAASLMNLYGSFTPAQSSSTLTTSGGR